MLTKATSLFWENKEQFEIKIVSIISIVFSVLGTFFVLGAFLLTFIFQAIQNNQIEVVGTIMGFEEYYRGDGEYERRTMVSYEVDGESYTSAVSYYSSSMQIGDSISVFYDDGIPAKISPSSKVIGNILFMVFGIIGGIFLIVGVGMGIVVRIRKKKTIKNIPFNEADIIESPEIR